MRECIRDDNKTTRKRSRQSLVGASSNVVQRTKNDLVVWKYSRVPQRREPHSKGESDIATVHKTAISRTTKSVVLWICREPTMVCCRF